MLIFQNKESTPHLIWFEIEEGATQQDRELFPQQESLMIFSVWCYETGHKFPDNFAQKAKQESDTAKARKGRFK